MRIYNHIVNLFKLTTFLKNVFLLFLRTHPCIRLLQQVENRFCYRHMMKELLLEMERTWK